MTDCIITNSVRFEKYPILCKELMTHANFITLEIKLLEHQNTIIHLLGITF